MPNQRAPGVTPRTVAFPDELWERVRREAAECEVSLSAVVRWAIEEHLASAGY